MKIVTTPMCKDVLELAGIKEFEINPDPDSTNADIAVVLSESNITMKSVKVKLNTFTQIKKSVELLSDIFDTDPLVLGQDFNLYDSLDTNNRKIKVKVYSDFLREIVDDLGYTIVSGDQNYHYIVYPDYKRVELSDEIKSLGNRVVEIPSHKNANKNPLKRAEMRYKLLEKKLCMKP
jgi:segregation and condensation protein B